MKYKERAEEQQELLKLQREKELKDKEDAEQLQTQLKLQQEKDSKDKEDAEQLQTQLKLLRPDLGWESLEDHPHFP